MVRKSFDADSSVKMINPLAGYVGKAERANLELNHLDFQSDQPCYVAKYILFKGSRVDHGANRGIKVSLGSTIKYFIVQKAIIQGSNVFLSVSGLVQSEFFRVADERYTLGSVFKFSISNDECILLDALTDLQPCFIIEDYFIDPPNVFEKY